MGLFPRARQADRAIDDLAGNIFEWCASLYDPKSKDTTDARVVRGWSWAFYLRVERSANRNGFGPELRDDSFGFRVTCVPPSLGADH